MGLILTSSGAGPLPPFSLNDSPILVVNSSARHRSHYRESQARPMETPETEDNDWTTGNDPDLSHRRIIDMGAFGEVHEVRFCF